MSEDAELAKDLNSRLGLLGTVDWDNANRRRWQSIELSPEAQEVLDYYKKK